MQRKARPKGDAALDGRKVAHKVFRLPIQKMYPKEIQFCAETYKIIFKKGLDCYGETDPGAKTIKIKDGLSPRNLFATFVHEIIHVIELELPFRIKHKDVYKLEKAIVELFLDNFL